ncbi:hypothetical protein CBR_g478 [Chara braunii]|uniref:Uncharacterized protein n=1 Tax=Chara braunii TaxID=69332 RepID=A0A388KBB1_CHABU|nr:hypothetical protein CBR_g478 [Chara braunii]|eukprot:GBG67340.1 hypothetical protein CBR_g478 [Chara braunii]
MEELERWTDVRAILKSIFDLFKERAEGPAEIQLLKQQLLDTVRDIATFVERVDNPKFPAVPIPRCLVREESDSLRRELERARNLAVGGRNQTFWNRFCTMVRRSDPQLRLELRQACDSLKSLLSNLDVMISARDAMVAREHSCRAVTFFNDKAKEAAQRQSDYQVFDRLTENFGRRLCEDQNEKVLRLCSQLYYTNGDLFALGTKGGTEIGIVTTGQPENHNAQATGKRKRGTIDRTFNNGTTAKLKMLCDGKFWFYVFHSTGAEFRKDFSRNLRLIYPVNGLQNNASPGEEIPTEHAITRRPRQFPRSERIFPDSGDDISYTVSAEECPSMLMLYVALTRRNIVLPENGEDGSRERVATRWILENMQCAEAVVKRISILVKPVKVMHTGTQPT